MLYRDHIRLKHSERERLQSELQDAKESEKQKNRGRKQLKQQQFGPAAIGDGEFDLADIDKEGQQQGEVVEGTAICNALVAHMIQALVTSQGMAMNLTEVVVSRL